MKKRFGTGRISQKPTRKMTKFQVLCTECGMVKKEVSQNGEVVEPSAEQKAIIIAREHEDKNPDCTGLIQPKPS